LQMTRKRDQLSVLEIRRIPQLRVKKKEHILLLCLYVPLLIWSLLSFYHSFFFLFYFVSFCVDFASILSKLQDSATKSAT
jgi:hypothetical protein